MVGDGEAEGDAPLETRNEGADQRAIDRAEPSAGVVNPFGRELFQPLAGSSDGDASHGFDALQPSRVGAPTSIQLVIAPAGSRTEMVGSSGRTRRARTHPSANSSSTREARYQIFFDSRDDGDPHATP